MIICELKNNQRTDALVSELVDIWEDSVRATHSFLTHADIETIKLYVPHAIKAVPHLFVARENTGSIHGFLGISGQKIEMLFIATHSFLTHADIETIKLYVPHAIKAVPHLFVARENTGSIHGFLGISGQKIEMLFIATQYRGHGLGKKSIQETMSLYPITDVVVNEQNQQAIGFYEHMGFEVYDRSAIDEHGGTFPILFMRKP